MAWWEWAWRTPQAAAWDDGALFVVARRAQLEDDLDALATVDDCFDLAELLGVEVSELTKRMTGVFRRLKGLASNKVAVAKECRELDNRLGLNPKAMGELRWRIVPDEEWRQVVGVDEPESPPEPVKPERKERRHLLAAS